MLVTVALKYYGFIKPFGRICDLLIFYHPNLPYFDLWGEFFSPVPPHDGQSSNEFSQYHVDKNDGPKNHLDQSFTQKLLGCLDNRQVCHWNRLTLPGTANRSFISQATSYIIVFSFACLQGSEERI